MEKIKDIATQFKFTGNPIKIVPLKIGHINDSYIVTDESGSKYFLQKINTNVFKDPKSLQENILKVTNHLRDKYAEGGTDDVDRHVMRIIPTKNNNLYFRSPNGEAWRAFTFITNSHSEDSVNPSTAYLAGKAFGEFQNMLADLDPNEITESIPNFHSIPFRYSEFQEAKNKDARNATSIPEIKSIIKELDDRYDEMALPERLFADGRLSKRINHCDAKVNNMLLDENGNPIAIVDLDTVMPSFVLSDFGDFMRTGANAGEEDDKNLDNIKIKFDVFDAFAKGYIQTAKFLTDVEIDLLPLGFKMLTYMQSMRFFTDYLNGDIYYKIKYPEHNLQRTRAQLKLLHEIDSNYETLINIINKYAKPND